MQILGAGGGHLVRNGRPEVGAGLQEDFLVVAEASVVAEAVGRGKTIN